jgi:hypothetical protein
LTQGFKCKVVLITEASEGRSGILDGPLVLVGAYLLVRCVHLSVYAVAARPDCAGSSRSHGARLSEHKDAEEQSNFRAGQCVAEHLAPLMPNPPQVTAGEVVAYKAG